METHFLLFASLKPLKSKIGLIQPSQKNIAHCWARPLLLYMPPTWCWIISLKIRAFKNNKKYFVWSLKQEDHSAKQSLKPDPTPPVSHVPPPPDSLCPSCSGIIVLCSCPFPPAVHFLETCWAFGRRAGCGRLCPRAGCGENTAPAPGPGGWWSLDLGHWDFTTPGGAAWPPPLLAPWGPLSCSGVPQSPPLHVCSSSPDRGTGLCQLGDGEDFPALCKGSLGPVLTSAPGRSRPIGSLMLGRSHLPVAWLPILGPSSFASSEDGQTLQPALR